jgi:urocanate hydratase
MSLTSKTVKPLIRHADAGYEEAIEFAEKNDVNLPMRGSLPKS